MHDQRRILGAIGNTPLIELRRIVPKGSARIVAKLESANPTGSMKDRLARTIIERAAAAGRLTPGAPQGRWWRQTSRPPTHDGPQGKAVEPIRAAGALRPRILV